MKMKMDVVILSGLEWDPVPFVLCYLGSLIVFTHGSYVLLETTLTATLADMLGMLTTYHPNSKLPQFLSCKSKSKGTE